MRTKNISLFKIKKWKENSKYKDLIIVWKEVFSGKDTVSFPIELVFSVLKYLDLPFAILELMYYCLSENDYIMFHLEVKSFARGQGIDFSTAILTYGYDLAMESC